MTTHEKQNVFGPVPSRRLGRSCGINIIPTKICSYSCIYCQIGRTVHLEIDRKQFYDPDTLLHEVGEALQKIRTKDISLDYFTFVANGEPTLEKNLGRLIDRVGTLGIKTAVISNASLVDNFEIRESLKKADWISLKVDAADHDTWKKINRPHSALQLPSILEGILKFREVFRGTLVTETMLVRGVNDTLSHFEALAGFLTKLRPDRSYLSIPTRPPAVKWVKPPFEEDINKAYQVLNGQGIPAEYLIHYEGNRFDRTGNIEENILGITSVHPMREDALEEYLLKADADWSLVEAMIEEKKLVETSYNQKKYYMRRSTGPSNSN